MTSIGSIFYYNFNSQPHKEADSFVSPSDLQPLYFNSQPHKEADGILGWVQDFASISTHSLTRRLTIDLVKEEITAFISTHSLTRRLTVAWGSGRVPTGVFQLTASQGG